jgi:choloylglycine hydrolase
MTVKPSKYLLVLSIVTMIGTTAIACTGIVLHADDGAVIPARTMEFSFDIHSDILVIPAGTEITNLVMDAKNAGGSYIAKYGFAGANALGKPIIVDGINEKGLYFGAFYFKNLARFQKLTTENCNRAISSEELGNYILSQFATVQEVKNALPNLVIVGTWIKEINGIAPLHYAVTDAGGESIVIEFTEKGLKIFDNTANVVTNNPDYDWHLTNLNNYVGLTDENRSEQVVGRQTLRPFGEGTGLFGLPGDSSSPSRFVRATAFTNSILPPKTADEAVFSAFHILNNFDIAKGSIRNVIHGNIFTDYTVWTSVADTENRVYYSKTYLAQQVDKVDLPLALKGLKHPKIIKIESDFSVNDRSLD